EAGPEQTSAADADRKSVNVTGGRSARPTASAAAAEKKSGGGSRSLLMLFVFVLLVVGFAYTTRTVWMPAVAPYLTWVPGFGGDADVSAAPESSQASPVDALRDRVASLEQTLAASGNTVDTAMAAMKQEKERVQVELNAALSRIDDLEKRLSEVRTLASAITSNTGQAVDLEPILSRIDGLEQQGRETTGEVKALANKVETMPARGTAVGQGVVLAIAQLRDAALSGRPYAAQLSALHTVAGGNTDIIAAASRLSASADTGLVTHEQLQARFSGIAGDIVSEARSGSGDWLQQAAGKLSALVALRRTDGSSGNPVEDAVARIEHDLNIRDAASAVKTASALADILQGKARSLLEPWLLDAKTRATAERALDAMHASALAALEG
ncbi:MAG: hypothetical protein WD624_03770, partial [Rhodospirillales bacterium]